MLKGVLVNGQWTTEPNRVKEEIRLFFKRFQDSEENRPRLDRVRFQAIGQYHNEILVEHFHEKESNDAMWECESEKSPGPDGLNFKFIKEFWGIIKSDVLRFLDEFYVNGIFPKGSNASILALIPKVQDPQNLNDYRPISLIGNMYKIVAKLLARRLKGVLPSIIDEQQTTFVEGRHMLHSVLIVNEVVEEAKRFKKPCLVFKADYEKAYNSVSWEFMLYMLKRMGFYSKWIV